MKRLPDTELEVMKALWTSGPDTPRAALDQALAAQAAGADYLGVGAVFPSPTKKNAIRITTEQLGEICDSVSIPCVAIGGISRENLPALAGGGMDGFALVSAIFSQPDIEAACRELRALAERTVKECSP